MTLGFDGSAPSTTKSTGRIDCGDEETVAGDPPLRERTVENVNATTSAPTSSSSVITPSATSHGEADGWPTTTRWRCAVALARISLARARAARTCSFAALRALIEPSRTCWRQSCAW